MGQRAGKGKAVAFRKHKMLVGNPQFQLTFHDDATFFSLMGVAPRATDRSRRQVAHQDFKAPSQIGREQLVDSAGFEHDFAAASGADDEGAFAVIVGSAVGEEVAYIDAKSAADF